MKLNATYKFEQFKQPIIEPETVCKSFTDEDGLTHIEALFISEKPNRAVYLGTTENVDNIESEILERLKSFEV